MKAKLPDEKLVKFAHKNIDCSRSGLAPEYDDDFGGDLAHAVVMQHVSKALIDEFVADIKLEF